MRTEESRPIRLEDYRPPDWLVDAVELDVSLDPAATQVRAVPTATARHRRLSFSTARR